MGFRCRAARRLRDSARGPLRKWRRLWGAGLAMLLLASIAPCAAQSSGHPDTGLDMPPARQGATLNVGTAVAPPFVMRGDDGRFSGVSMGLWQAVAARLGLRSHYVTRDLKGLFTGLQDGSLDISVAALTVTAARESKIDFTYPFYSTGLAIAVPSGGSRVWATVSRLFSWPFFTALGGLAGLLLVVGVAVWLFERRHNAEEFGGGPVKGLASGFWWAAVTMTTVGYGDKSPRTLGGRLVGLVWMFAAIILISSFTAAIATSLTVSQLSTGINGVQDLSNARVVTIAHSAAAAALKSRGIAFSTRSHLAPALKALVSHRVDAVVYDAPLLRYLVLNHYPNRLRVLDKTFERQDYAFALPQGSKLREPINRAILAYMRGSDWHALLNRYLGHH